MDWTQEYPRPQLRRDSFFSLNGRWMLNGLPIEVPFPPQSRLAAYSGRLESRMTYERAFTLPEALDVAGRP